MDAKITFKRTEKKNKHFSQLSFLPFTAPLKTLGKKQTTMTAWFMEVHKYLYCWKIKENPSGNVHSTGSCKGSLSMLCYREGAKGCHILSWRFKHYWDKIDAQPFGLLISTLQNKDILGLDYVQQNTVSKYAIKEGHSPKPPPNSKPEKSVKHCSTKKKSICAEVAAWCCRLLQTNHSAGKIQTSPKI